MTETIPSLLTVRQFSQKHTAFPEGGMRYRIFHSNKNGFDSCVRRVGAKVLIDEAEFFKWIDEQNNQYIFENLMLAITSTKFWTQDKSKLGCGRYFL